MTPQTIITTARSIVNDTDSTLYRLSNTVLVDFVNAGMKEISSLMPGLFFTVGTHLCTVGTVQQALTFTTAQALVKVLGINGGAAVTPFDYDAMNSFNTGWRTDTAGAATQWARLPNDPLRFFIYPKAPASAQTLDVMYVAIPTTVALTDSITEVPASYEPALADYVIYRAESLDDEHANSGRAVAHYTSFVTKVKGA